MKKRKSKINRKKAIINELSKNSKKSDIIDFVCEGEGITRKEFEDMPINKQSKLWHQYKKYVSPARIWFLLNGINIITTGGNGLAMRYKIAKKGDSEEDIKNEVIKKQKNEDSQKELKKLTFNNIVNQKLLPLRNRKLLQAELDL